MRAREAEVERVKSLEEQLADSAASATESKRRATDAEWKVVEARIYVDQEMKNCNTEESAACEGAEKELVELEHYRSRDAECR